MPFLMGGGSVPLIGRRAGALAGGGAPAVRPESYSYFLGASPPTGTATSGLGAIETGFDFEVTSAVRVWSLRAFVADSFGVSSLELQDLDAAETLTSTGALPLVFASWVEEDVEPAELDPGVTYRLTMHPTEQFKHYYDSTPPGPYTDPLLASVSGFRGSPVSYVPGWLDMGYELI